MGNNLNNLNNLKFCVDRILMGCLGSIKETIFTQTSVSNKKVNFMYNFNLI